MISKVVRFEGNTLAPLGRMKAADRKAGTVGDIVVLDENELPVEAVEIKFDQLIEEIHVAEAIEKVRAASVSRYYLLSTSGVVMGEELTALDKRKREFLKQNGCEIIVNGVIETIAYYLRLLPNTTEFIANYASLVEADDDTDYNHRIAWNKLCSRI